MTDASPEPSSGGDASLSRTATPAISGHQRDKAPWSSPALPAGWTSMVSKTHGDVYYINSETGETSWDVPTAESAAPAATAAAVAAPAAEASDQIDAAAEARAAQDARLIHLSPEDGGRDSSDDPERLSAEDPEGSGSARGRYGLLRGKALLGKAKTKAANVSVTDTRAAAFKHTGAVVQQSRKGLARAADGAAAVGHGAAAVGGVTNIVEKQRLKSDQQDAMMDHVVEVTEKLASTQMQLEEATEELERFRVKENADERVAELMAALAEAAATAEGAVRQAAATAQQAAEHAVSASEETASLSAARAEAGSELEALRNELAATRLQLRKELSDCKAEREASVGRLQRELGEQRTAHDALRQRAEAGQSFAADELAAEKGAHEATKQEAAADAVEAARTAAAQVQAVEQTAAGQIQALEAQLTEAAETAEAEKLSAERALKQRLVAIEAKHQQATVELKKEVSELTRSLQTERMSHTAAQTLNEKLFNEMNAVV